MASINKVIIIGNLGRDPEVKYTPSGMAVCNMSVATTRSWKDKSSGDKVEETEWHRVAMYDKLAEIAGEYLKKGRPVYIEGRLKTRKWQDKDGKDTYTTEIIAEQMQMLGGKDGGEQGGQQRSAAPAQAQRQAPAAAPAPRSGGGGGGGGQTGFNDMDDDIPFASPHANHDPMFDHRKLARSRGSRFAQ